MATQAFFSITGNAQASGVKLRLTANYSEIAASLGLTPVAATDPGEPISSGQAVGRKFGSKLRITVKEGTKKRSSHLVFCAADAEDTAIRTLPGKNFGGKPIISAGYRRIAKMH